MPSIDSSVISHADYDDIREELRIIFTSQRIYTYVGVPEEVYQELLNSESKGGFFNNNIRNKYRFRK